MVKLLVWKRLRIFFWCLVLYGNTLGLLEPLQGVGWTLIYALCVIFCVVQLGMVLTERPEEKADHNQE